MEDFVTFEILKKLKEKWFREDCIAKVNLDNTITFNHVFDNDIRTVFKCHNKLNPYVDAPTISQVLKWMREEKKIHIGFGYSPRKKWRYVVMYIDDRFYNKPTLAVDGFLEIEKATLAGIEYALDNLI